MNADQQKALLTIALLAAFSDGANNDREREQIRDMAESLGGEEGASHLRGLYQQVLLKQVSVADVAGVLVETGHRQLAYEMAVCVCDADGAMTEAERQFLDGLATSLGLDQGTTAAVIEQAEGMATAETVIQPGTPRPATKQAAAGGAVSVSDAELDRSILNYSILNGALELLPQSWASMAIIPLQIKMVYGIGKSYGHELDQGHIRELLATVGVGMTSQYLEQFGRKLLGGLLGKVGGGLGKQLGRSATSMAFSFATTYALGQVARRYYAGGRQMSTELLRDTFQTMLGPAKELQTRYLPEIQQKAGTLDAGQVMSMVRGR
ncbi:DUF533 domain-containing protein [Azoarcus sp. L1K30]|nr:DUF533 domain-containing protein [Azoarcus sp. L1K30]